MKGILTFVIVVSFIQTLYGQSTVMFADSIRKQYKIPELGYAVVSSDSVLEINVLGERIVNAGLNADMNDRFRIGSNTKAVTGIIAAQIVKQGKIAWDTKYFDLFPEQKSASNRAYWKLTLLKLLSFRTRLFPYTYTWKEPAQDQFSGNEEQQRLQFAIWFFGQKPVSSKSEVNFSNLGYVAAGQMLEKVSGKSYKELVAALGQQLGIRFGFGNPSTSDSLQPYGHDQHLMPEPTGDNHKLNWLLPAGNINVSLPDYVKFIQLQLKGLAGQSDLLSREEFTFLHRGLPRFAVGWFWGSDANGQVFSYNIGNPGTFLSKVYVYHDLNRAFILFANAQTNDTDAGLNVLYEELKKRY